ncbi:ATP-binding protein [Kribbella solani]|uniref:ATP-binding protein n=1 Tax=Kribbella solani TaxID=236067 RepID=A0A841DV92_9ACTN|nr:ATP-binding protein [Kribbella solani]MBB5981871.1 hypothetical protein [Kribbella solani]
MSQVFGTVRHPAYFIRRVDRLGTPISLGETLPESRAILYTGPPGMGKTTELNQAEDLAQRQGWTAIRLNASAVRPIEHQLTAAVRANLDLLRSRYKGSAVRDLATTVQDLTHSGRNTRMGWEGRLGGGIIPVEFVAKREKDTTAYDNLGTTLNDFADKLAALSEEDGKPILLLIDNVDRATEDDQAGLNELAIHIEVMHRPVWLVAAGGSMSTSALMTASRRMSGIATTISNQFDIRELGPLTADELRPALTEPLIAAGIPFQFSTVERLLKAANGDPARLRMLSEAALGFRDPVLGITGTAGTMATLGVYADAAEWYQGAWNQKTTSHEQKDLLARVAAQGPNGLYMPADMAAAGDDRWPAIDEARQQLVARGLLRDHPGQYVTIPDEGFQDWLNEYLGQTPVLDVEPGRLEQLRGQPALAPAHPTGDRALVNQVFGTSRSLVRQVDRVDQSGRPISLDQRLPRGTSVLFTGPPGMGTSQELTRTKALADRQGWITIRLDASRRESLEARVIRAVRGEMDAIKQRFPSGQVKDLKALLNRLAVRTRNSMNTAQVRFGMSPGPKVGVHTAWEGVTKDSVGTTLNEVAAQFGAMAGPEGKPILMMVDNLDAASKDDLIALTELSSHLREQRQPMFLIAAGGEEATSRLLEASGGRNGKETNEVAEFDVRRLQPLSPDQLREALTFPLEQAGIKYEAAAVDSLIEAANGIPTRLRTLAGAALELADPGVGITVDVAAAATAKLNAQSQALYNAAWHNCSPAEKQVLARTASHGARGIEIPARSETPDRWSLDEATQKLVSRGLLTRTGHQIRVADPGFRDWVQTRLGVNTAQTGIAHPTATRPAAAQHGVPHTPQPATTRPTDRRPTHHAIPANLQPNR